MCNMICYANNTIILLVLKYYLIYYYEVVGHIPPKCRRAAVIQIKYAKAICTARKCILLLQAHTARVAVG